MHLNPVIQHLYDQLDQRKNRQQQINKLTSQLGVSTEFGPYRAVSTFV